MCFRFELYSILVYVDLASLIIYHSLLIVVCKTAVELLYSCCVSSNLFSRLSLFYCFMSNSETVCILLHFEFSIC